MGYANKTLKAGSSAGPPSLNAMLRGGKPVWDEIAFDVFCPRCGYNLRMLPTNRCPECGLKFEWSKLLNEGAWRSDFLFEHHWRKKPLRSWWATFWRGLRPVRFWRQVYIHERVLVGPLIFLLVTSVFLQVATVCCAFWLAALVCRIIGMVFPTMWRISSVGESLAQVANSFATGEIEFVMFWAMPMWTAFGVILGLRQTLGRARVRSVQVLRVMAYSSGLVHVWSGLGWSALWIASMVWFDRPSSTSPDLVGVAFTLLAALLWIGIVAFYIAAGLRTYLQLPRAALLGVAAAFIGLLCAMTFSAALSIARMS